MKFSLLFASAVMINSSDAIKINQKFIGVYTPEQDGGYVPSDFSSVQNQLDGISSSMVQQNKEFWDIFGKSLVNRQAISSIVNLLWPIFDAKGIGAITKK